MGKNPEGIIPFPCKLQKLHEGKALIPIDLELNKYRPITTGIDDHHQKSSVQALQNQVSQVIHI